jgi:hypothetical protein
LVAEDCFSITAVPSPCADVSLSYPTSARYYAHMSLTGLLSRIRRLYHFTDTRNLPLIRRLGGLYSTARLREKGVDGFHTGGNNWSLEADMMSGMDQYVHLCLRDSHPMEYLARTDGRIAKSVFLRIDTDVLRLEGVRFSPGVSNKSGVEPCDIEDALDQIDFDVLYSWHPWKNPEIKARLLAAEKCEILVPNHVGMKFLEKHFPNG